MTRETYGDIHIMTPESPQIDALNSEEFKEELKTAAADASKVLIDLSSVQFIDSSGLGVLLGLLREMNQRDGTVALCSAQTPVQVLFRMVRMSNIVTIYENRDDALSSLST